MPIQVRPNLLYVWLYTAVIHDHGGSVYTDIHHHLLPLPTLRELPVVVEVLFLDRELSFLCISLLLVLFHKKYEYQWCPQLPHLLWLHNHYGHALLLHDWYPHHLLILCE